MQKRLINTLLVLTLLLLVSCGRVPQGEDPTETSRIVQQVKTGTQGVELTLTQNFPPREVYDLNELIALVEVRNRGNHDLEPQECFVQVSGFDPNIIIGEFSSPRSCAEGIGVFEGKKLYNLEGGLNQIEFRSSNIALPEGVFDYEPTLNYKTCYLYQTRASPSVCVDPLLYQISSEQKACDYRRNVVTGGGQGGPVGVSNVNVDMLGSKAVFEINIQNYGGGVVTTPHTDIRNCDVGLEYTEIGKIFYNVQLGGASVVDCKPRDGFVRMVNNQGKIICTFDIPPTSAYETPLRVDLDYGYVKSITRPLQIIKTPQ